VRAIRIDNLERSVQVKLERDAAGRWFLTDPVPYPALAALVRTLLTTLETARGEPAREVDVHEVGLDPPRAVVECVLGGAGGERTIRVELGGEDVVPDRIFARVPGHPGPRPRAATCSAPRARWPTRSTASRTTTAIGARRACRRPRSRRCAGAARCTSPSTADA
jgi:hypothetical protein